MIHGVMSNLGGPLPRVLMSSVVAGVACTVYVDWSERGQRRCFVRCVSGAVFETFRYRFVRSLRDLADSPRSWH